MAVNTWGAPNGWGESGVSVAPATASQAYTGQTPAVTVGNAVIVLSSNGSQAYTGQQPTIVAGASVTVAPGVGNVVYIGFSPIVRAGDIIAPPAIRTRVITTETRTSTIAAESRIRLIA